MSVVFPDASATAHNVPKEYVRAVDAQLLPPRVGHNWSDQAFRKHQDRPQQLEGELRGTRAFTSSRQFRNPPPDHLGRTAQQLMQALSTTSRTATRHPHLRDSGDGGYSSATGQAKRFVTLDDKVLRFYAFFYEDAPEGGARERWVRQVVLYFYLEDSTVMIEEPRIPNSGLDGGVFLKRQKVEADPRTRERHHGERYLTVDSFNVGEPVRINALLFFLYDCDAFTREFLTSIGVEVGAPTAPPEDPGLTTYATGSRKLLFGSFSAAHDQRDAEMARGIEDAGKVLRFSALLDERGTPTAGGVVRQLELLMFAEDDTVAVVERQTTAETCPRLFLSRGWLPKSGSVAKLNELTFTHRVNGQRRPDVGPDGFYSPTDLGIGVTINVLGRRVLLYDCDDFTRAFYAQRYNIELGPRMDVRAYLPEPSPAPSTAGRAEHSVGGAAAARARACRGERVVLRYFMRLADAATPRDRMRRFTLSFDSASGEATVFETAVPNTGFPGGSILKRQRLPKPKTAAAVAPRVAARATLRQEEPEYYTKDDIAIGKCIVVNGLRLCVSGVDPATEAHQGGVTTAAGAPSSSSSEVQPRLTALLEFLNSRYGSAGKAFLALDHDRDGVVSAAEFTAALDGFHVTSDASLARALFEAIAAEPSAAYLTTDDIMRWMGGSTPQHPATQGSRDEGDAVAGAAQQAALAARVRRIETLRGLWARLEARCYNTTSMFRLASVLPRAYGERRGDVKAYSNIDRDAIITPVQLRRCVHDILGANCTEAELHDLLEFFFSEMPPEEHLRLRDDALDCCIDLQQFQARCQDLARLTMLPERPNEELAAMKTTSKPSQ